MKAHVTACLGIFAVMALSNAIVPVLPEYADASSLQGAVYSAYFLGAFLLTFPAGLLSDRYGKAGIMRAGLAVTVISGLFLLVASGPLVAAGARFLEGTGAGLFVAAAMSFVNALPDHERMSGYFMASLNAGLVLGLAAGGILASHTGVPSAGILFFTALTAVFMVPGIGMDAGVPGEKQGTGTVLPTLAIAGRYRWLWYSAIVLVGATGVVTSLYPAYSDAASDVSGLWISAMSVATIAAVMVASRMDLPPVPTIRVAALAMAAGVVFSYYTPAGFLVVGAVAGIVMIAQMAFLAGAGRDRQGVAMGMFSATSYLGMSLLSFLAGILSDATSFYIAFLATALAALSVAPLIGRCSCTLHGNPSQSTHELE